MRRRHPTHSDAASSKDFFELKKFRSRHYICRRSTKVSIPVFQTGDGVSGSLACSIYQEDRIIQLVIRQGFIPFPFLLVLMKRSNYFRFGAIILIGKERVLKIRSSRSRGVCVRASIAPPYNEHCKGMQRQQVIHKEINTIDVKLGHIGR